MASVLDARRRLNPKRIAYEDKATNMVCHHGWASLQDRYLSIPKGDTLGPGT